ncbi:MAG: hypothetical protein KDH96_07665 [Candidatus Riesia sp.]|nr:hypothetical protein [Candidatus Riesia sp.]
MSYFDEVIIKDKFDRKAWLNVTQAFKDYHLSQKLLADLHTSLLKPKPLLKSESQIDNQYLNHRNILDQMFQTSEWRTLHAITQNDPLGAALGVMALADKLDQDTQESQVRLVARKACKNAIQQIQKGLENFATWGSDPDKPIQLDLQKSIELAQTLRNSPKLKQISEIAGRLKSTALQKRSTKAAKLPEEIIDIEIGNNLNQVLPSEFLSPLFYKNYIEQTLMQRKLQSTTKLAKGPVIFCLDESGSMKGDKEIWSKAYFMGFQTLAAKDKRDLAYISFGVSVTHSQVFPKAEIDPIYLTQMLSEFAGHGGTDFDQPLEKSLELLKNSLPKADIVFVTDGVSNISQSVKEKLAKAKSEKGLHLYVVLINDQDTTVFDDLADLIVYLNTANTLYERI